MADVFVSYKAEDRQRIRPLVDALEAEGLSVWWDARVGGGEAWRETIQRELEGAACVIVAWSKRSTGPEGRFVRDEASRAQRRGAYLPVTIDKVSPPLGFGEVQALPLSRWKGDPSDRRFREISDCVHAMLGRSIPLRPDSGKRAVVDRRTAIVAGGSAAAVLAAGGLWMLLRPSRAKANTIAVLPFANLSGDKNQDYFSDGMAEEVRSALAATSGLEVVARTSSEMLRNADAVTAAKRLGVANVITGSVRRSTSTVRVSAQLVDGRSGLERWSKSFDRPLGDILQIQTDIAANVARELSVALIGIADRLRLGGTRNPAAQDLYLQAIASEGDDSSEAMLKRIALYAQAIELDPNYAAAIARKGLIEDLWANAWATSTAEKERVESRAMDSIRRAIKIAPEMPLGHSSLGLVYRNRLEMRRSMAELRRAVSLPGADSLDFFNYGSVLSNFGKAQEAVSMVHRSLVIDPLNPVARTIYAWTLFFSRRFSEALDAGRQALAIAPANSRARAIIASSLLMLDRIPEAQEELKRIAPDDYRRLVLEAFIATRLGNPSAALKSLAAIRDRHGDATNYQFAQIYAQLGRVDEAVAALEKAWIGRDAGLGAMLVDPFMDPVRKDPRFSSIAKRVFT